MKTIRTTLAMMLIGLACIAFESDALAQTRRGGTTTGSGSTTSRTSSSNSSKSTTPRGSEVKKTATTKPAASTSKPVDSKPATTVTKPSSQKPATSSPQVTRPSTTTKPAATKPAASTSKPAETKPATTVTRPAPTKPVETKPADKKPAAPTTKPADKKPAAPTTKPADKPITVTRPGHQTGDRKPQDTPGMKPGTPGKPATPAKPGNFAKPDPNRVHPREHDFLRYSKPSYFWSSKDHYYGYKVKTLPRKAVRHTYYGVTYYCHNDIWYRPYGGHYIVCRPPFGISLAANVISDMTWAAVRMSYYYTAVQTYSQISENNAYIAQQNAIIAQNNAIIAQQNAQILAGQTQAQTAYSLATSLGLVQSFAAAESTYYYQDGVFYILDATGQYRVIVPPAGALVDSLPEDYDVVVLADGREYYQVDDTIYTVTVNGGELYFEVLGQRY